VRHEAVEQLDLLERFTKELGKAVRDGAAKRAMGTKPPWYDDDSHEAAVFSHWMKYKKGELADADSGAHPLVHAAARCLMIACRETGNVPPARPRLNLVDGSHRGPGTDSAA
jgi:hypothetical protein